MWHSSNTIYIKADYIIGKHRTRLRGKDISCFGTCLGKAKILKPVVNHLKNLLGVSKRIENEYIYRLHVITQCLAKTEARHLEF